MLEATCCDTAPAMAKRPEWKCTIPCSTWPPAAPAQQCGDPSAPAVAAASCSLPSPSPVAETVKTTMSEMTQKSQRGLNNNNKIFVKHKILSIDYSKHAHTHTHTLTEAPAHMSILTMQCLKCAATEIDEDSSMEQKAWQVSSLGKRNVFRLHLSESRGEVLSERKGEVIPCK